MKAVTTIRSRNGKGPFGSARAAANVTMPRIPHQETTRPLFTVGAIIGRGGWKPKSRTLSRAIVL